MNKRDLLKKAGSMQQLAYVRPVRMLEGRSVMEVIDVKNGPMQLKLMADKALDCCELSFRGINMSFLSKPGLQGRGHYDTHGEEAVRSIMGGLFFTSGLENICAPCTIDGTDYPMHGRMRSTPAEHVCCDAYWEGEDYVLSVSGEMREAALFGENLVLRRKISTVYGTNTFTVTDEIENESFRDEPMMILYHINLGYPFLDEGTKLYMPTRRVTARDTFGEGHEEEYDRMDPPKDNEPEYVFIHDLIPDPDGRLWAAAINEDLGIGLKIEWNVRNLPFFMEWKSTASGDYVIGLEPANSSVYGRTFHEKEGTVHRMAPFTKEINCLTFTILEGETLRDFERTAIG